MNTIKIEMSEFITNLCNKTYREQIAVANSIITNNPVGYVKSKGVEDIIVDNAALIEGYYLEHAEQAKNAPETVKELLWQELGEKLCDLVERNQ